MREVMLWNLDGTRSVKASKIRDFGIYRAWTSGTGKELWELKGWYNANEGFEFGVFDTRNDARKFLKLIHEQIEERN